MPSKRPKPVVLCILDGFGHRDAREDNAIAHAHTPTLDYLRAAYPYGTINASEQHVGLPEAQMGNSEVGHMNIGAGRVVMQDLPRIDEAVATGALARNPGLLQFLKSLKASGGTCHLLGLLSDGGVHAHQSHITELARIVALAGVPVVVHPFLDGRDTAPQSALAYVAAFEDVFKDRSDITIGTVSGRYYAMDRDKRWERVENAYTALTRAEGEHAPDAISSIEASYAAGKTDEFMLPTIIGDYAGMKNGDGLLMANFRADRARQLLHAFLDPAFDGFARTPIDFAATLGLVEYSVAINAWVPALFPPQSLSDLFGEIVAREGLTQLRIAETEKYAHVTFFFNGGREEPFAGEERILVPSPKVATYDLKPEMSAPEVTDKLVEAIENDRFDVIIVNYANADMVGHSGSLAAATKAVEAIDACMTRLVAAVEAKHGVMIVTADHGNVEELHDHSTGQPHTAHTMNLVPFMLVGDAFKGTKPTIREGKLADIAPSLLDLLGLPKPDAMTGESLIPSMSSRHAVA